MFERWGVGCGYLGIDRDDGVGDGFYLLMCQRYEFLCRCERWGVGCGYLGFDRNGGGGGDGDL
eukprot:scaffold149123_cov35-Attheya_sp.AAC.1